VFPGDPDDAFARPQPTDSIRAVKTVSVQLGGGS
jgi:hypothetical protein